MSDYSSSAAAWDIEYPAGLADVGVTGEYLEFPQASDMNYGAHGVPNPSLPDSVWPSYYGSNMMSVSGSEVPEPSTLVLLGFGAVSLIAYAWRRRRTA